VSAVAAALFVGDETVRRRHRLFLEDGLEGLTHRHHATAAEPDLQGSRRRCRAPMRVLSGLLKNCLVGFEDGFIAAVDGELDLDGAVIGKFGRTWPVLSCRVQEFEQSPRLQAAVG
jgi:hypothetical protein